MDVSSTVGEIAPRIRDAVTVVVVRDLRPPLVEILHEGGGAAVYRMLRWGNDYIDIGEAAYEARYRSRTLANLIATAKTLGYNLVSQNATDQPSN